MPLYMFRWAFKDATIKGLTDNPQDREPPARAVIEAFGGRMQGYWFMLGDYDGMGIADFPDSVAAAACSMRISGTGAFSAFETHALLSAAEAKAAMQKAKDTAVTYRAPGS